MMIIAPTVSAAIIQLQSPHEVLSPSQRLQVLSEICDDENINGWDVYGDYHKTSDDPTSFLRKFESQVAKEFGKDDAVFMPSGVMAQSIALLIQNQQTNKKSFACHVTSHLLIHEQHGYKQLCGLDPVILPTTEAKAENTGFLGVPPLLHQHLKEADLDDVSTVILELPHRELGGKLTPFEDISKMSEDLVLSGIAFHCDGARIFEAAAGYQKPVSEIAELFDSVYISFYKGLGGLSGAMLLGNQEFCDEARIWLRRFGGNLYTLMPYIVSAWSGYQNNYILPKTKETDMISFEDKKDKLMRLSKRFAEDEHIPKILTLEPSTPQVNMVHCYLRPSEGICKKICHDVQDRKGVCLFQRIRALDKNDPGIQQGYECKLEISIGNENGNISDDIWFNAWRDFCLQSIEEMK